MILKKKSMCKKKKRIFSTIKNAKSVFDKMRSQGKKVKWIYYCPECEGYHITSWTKRQIIHRSKAKEKK